MRIIIPWKWLHIKKTGVSLHRTSECLSKIKSRLAMENTSMGGTWVPLCWEYKVTDGFQHKWSLMRKFCPCRDVVMLVGCQYSNTTYPRTHAASQEINEKQILNIWMMHVCGPIVIKCSFANALIVNHISSTSDTCKLHITTRHND